MYRTYSAYCSARDQAVRVVRKSEVMGAEAEAAYLDGSDVLCLAYGSACTGATCPLFEVPTGEMQRRLEAAGLRKSNGD